MLVFTAHRLFFGTQNNSPFYLFFFGSLLVHLTRGYSCPLKPQRGVNGFIQGATATCVIAHRWVARASVLSWFLLPLLGGHVPRCYTSPLSPHTAHGYSFLMAVSCFACPSHKNTGLLSLSKHAKPLRILRRLLFVRSASIHSAHPALHSLAFAVPLPRSCTSFRQGERSTLLDDFHSAIAPWHSARAITYALTRTGCADGEKNEQTKTVIP